MRTTRRIAPSSSPGRQANLRNRVLRPRSQAARFAPRLPGRDLTSYSLCLPSLCSASRAFSINCRLNFFSSSGRRLASPTTCTMPLPSTRRLAPIIFATGKAEVICTVGIPAFSNSVVIAAPLRVLVPHVEVRIIASMPSFLAFSAISRPMRRVLDSGLASPDVEINSSHNCTDGAVAFELAHHIQRHQPVGILPDELRIVAAVGNLIIFATQIVAVLDVVGCPTGSPPNPGSCPDCPSAPDRRR